MKSLSVGFVFAVLAVRTCACCVASDIDAAIKSLADRSRAVRSIEIAWSGTAFEMDPGPAGLQPTTNASRPISYPTRGKLLFELAGRFYLEHRAGEWSEHSRSVMPVDIVTATRDGKRDNLFVGGAASYPRFSTGLTVPSHPARKIRLLPIRLAYWPFDLSVGVMQAGEKAGRGGFGIIDGKEHLIVRSDGDEIWVDPTRNYVPVRYRRSKDNDLFTTVDVQYSDLHDGLRPAAWRISTFAPNGKVLMSYAETVDSITINPHFDASQFVITPPLGSWVTNYETNETYILLDSQNRRFVRRGEFTGSNYDELVRTSGLGWRLWGGVIAILIVLGSCALLFFRPSKLRR